MTFFYQFSFPILPSTSHELSTPSVNHKMNCFQRRMPRSIRELTLRPRAYCFNQHVRRCNPSHSSRTFSYANIQKIEKNWHPNKPRIRTKCKAQGPVITILQKEPYASFLNETADTTTTSSILKHSASSSAEKDIKEGFEQMKPHK